MVPSVLILSSFHTSNWAFTQRQENFNSHFPHVQADASEACLFKLPEQVSSGKYKIIQASHDSFQEELGINGAALLIH